MAPITSAPAPLGARFEASTDTPMHIFARVSADVPVRIPGAGNRSADTSGRKPIPARVSEPGQEEQQFEARIFDSFIAAEACWRTLEADANGSVYQRYDWCKTWFDCFAASLQAKALVIIIYQQGRPILLLPLYRRKTSLGLVRAQFMGDCHASIRLPLSARSAGVSEALSKVAANGQLMAMISAALGQQEVHVDLVTFGCMPQSFAGAQNVLFPAARSLCHDQIFVSELSDDFATLSQQRRGDSHLKKLRKKMRGLDAMGEVSFQRASTAQEVSMALDAFLEQKRARLNANKLDNAFDNADDRDFIRMLGHRSIEEGSRTLDVYTLTLSGKIIAVFAGGRFDGTFSGAINSISSDPAITQRSPGEIIVHRLIESLCGEGQRSFDLGIGGSHYKHGWCEGHALRQVCLPITFKGQLLYRMDRARQGLRALVLHHPRVGNAARHAKYHIKKLINRL
jgi:CelD/BcsL family acetyltransferase involved in cellulose biosynthesis